MELQDTDIYQALLDNNLQSLKKLLRQQDINQRGRDGRSYLHIVVDHTPNMDLIREILTHIDISFRDENGETALNLAHMYGKIDIYELILRRVGRLVMGKDVRAIEHLFLRGWDAWPIDVDKMMDIKLDIAKFFQQLPDLALKVETVHETIQRNNLQALKQHLTHHQVAVACDRLGLPPLQKAAIFQRNSIVEYIIAEYPTSLTVVDHSGRTALHYAACIEDSSLYDFLVEAGADIHILDLNGLSPEFYQKNPGVLKLTEVQRRIRSLQKRPRINNCFSLVAMMSSKDTNTLSGNVRSPFLRYNTSPALSNTPVKRTSANRDLMAKWRTLVNIIPIHSHFKSSRKNQNNELFEDTHLYEAIIMNDREEVKHLLGKNVNTNLRSLEGWSYLHLAVAHSVQKDIIRMLIENADVTLRDADGLTFLDLAIVSSAPNDIVEEVQRYILRWLKSGEVTLMKTLVLNGWASWPFDLYNKESASALPKKSTDFLKSISIMQETIINFHRHVMTCNMSKIRQQLTGSTSQLSQVDLLESCDQTGLPPLHKAVIFQCERAVQLLLNTFINAVDICDNMERTALHYAACLEDDGQMYTTLLDVGAENNIPDLWGFTAVEYREMPHLINMENIRDNILKMVATPPPSQSLVWPGCLLYPTMEESKLFKAIQEDNKDEVENLLTAGEDANIRDKDGKSLLHVAASKFNKDIVKALLKWVTGTARDEKGDNFVSALAAEGKKEEAKELRMLFLSHVIEEGKVEKAERILMDGWDDWEDVNVDEAKEKSEEMGDFFGRVQGNQAKIRSIHEAIRDGRLRDVKSLLDRKMLAQAADRTGMLPLQKAVVFQHEDIVKFIVAEFKDVIDLKDHMDRTALHYAAACTDSGALYEELKAAGANDSLNDVSWKTPADYREDPSLLRLDNIRTRLLHLMGPVQPSTEEETIPTQTSDLTPPPSAESSSEKPRRSATPPKSAEKKPLHMYIATDIYEKKNVPPPSTVDGKYVANNLGSALTMALAEIAERRPWDPIEYLAHWLYKYRQNLDHNKQQEALLKEIRSEEASLEHEEKERAVRREEQLRIQEEEAAKQKREEEEERKRKEQEELQRKAKEAAQLQKPQLPTVTEEGEEDSQNKERDEEGQTELHKLAAQQGADLIAVLNMGYSLADRDAKNRTARDIAEEEGLSENVESLDSYVTNLLEQENMDALQQLLLDGYDKLSDVIDRVSTDGLPDIVTDFVKSLPYYKEKISHVFKSVHSGHQREVAQAMERKKLAMVKDVYGRSPLHIAVLNQHMDIIKHIISNFPSTVRCRDNWNRTPLHYAMAVSDEIALYMREKGADPEAKDIKKRTPDYYKDEKDEILALKDSLDSAESSQPEDTEETEKGETTE